ncbi:sigma-54-dependent Fis family transcriptional regulator [Alteromonas sediminis]|uniref:Sigma-54-dependent Fis family transcriptional regulator n=1 Tax=Alteromonas sediminis TaxID=2259342 RepID=A0A3N5Y1W3_9ALTE|nr:sigma-54 dependent transcriptional regulator [Alteromonas sediminis]RPJ67240.1 sigma-54-dependent Fis family transcriptional regulator [Alteromonas sediminis]
MLTVLLVDDDPEFTHIACLLLEHMDCDVKVASTLAEARKWLSSLTFDHILIDFMLPDGSGMHVVDEITAISSPPKVTFITGHPAIKSIIADLCDDNTNYLVKPIDKDSLSRVLGNNNNNVAACENAINKHFGSLVGETEAMQHLYQQIERVANTKANVMIFGESGVGKELVAQAIHNQSSASGAFVATNCGAIAKDLISSELFGHEKGAFTGAISRKIGVFEQANNGTLFLDELTEMPLEQQPSLLRVLESKKLTRVGGTQSISVNCRVISATNKPVDDIATDNVLREDIYFRLAVFPLTVPPLRQRKQDIQLLADAFIHEYNIENATKYAISDKQIRLLQEYDWPGNVRELRHVLYRAAIMSDPYDHTLLLPMQIGSPFSKTTQNGGTIEAGRTIDDVEKELIYATLSKVSGNKTAAASMLGISTKTLYNRLHAYGDFEDEGA